MKERQTLKWDYGLCKVAQIQMTILDAFEIEISHGGYRKFGWEI